MARLDVDPDFTRDNDSLYVVPLKIVPFETPALRRGKLIKNTVLKPAIEVFQYHDGSSAQILIEDFTPELGSNLFGWKTKSVHSDLNILHKLARLTSYDVYSLRILFRELEIPIVSNDYLNLSETAKARLDGYMRSFTQPLIRRVYGHSMAEHLDASNIIKLFSDPDTEMALRNLQKLADVLGMPIRSIPTFLEDFADLYLSFSYYQSYLDDIVPKMVDLAAEISDLKENYQMKQDHHLMNVCRELVSNLNDLTASTTGRFEKFNNITDRMWDDISAERFRETQTLIRSYHTTIGGVLCGLGIKLNAWKKRFPKRYSGGPRARVEVLLSSMRPGMEKIMAIDKGAPLVPGAA